MRRHQRSPRSSGCQTSERASQSHRSNLPTVSASEACGGWGRREGQTKLSMGVCLCGVVRVFRRQAADRRKRSLISLIGAGELLPRAGSSVDQVLQPSSSPPWRTCRRLCQRGDQTRRREHPVVCPFAHGICLNLAPGLFKARIRL